MPFELFPAVLAVISVIVGIMLITQTRRARRGPPERPPVPKRQVQPGTKEKMGRGRPSMR